jgi:hypothetical protein
VTGGANEFLELPVGDRGPIDPETIHSDAMNRSLFGIMLIRSHAKRAAGDPDHIRGHRLVVPLD